MHKITVVISLFLLWTPPIFSVNPPDWSKDAIWYQIFPERFSNGDRANDPTMESLVGTWPWEDQSKWAVSPWTSDWFALQPWEAENNQPFNYQFQIRRYGGDLQGIINKLDYLQELGINAIYLNPVFDSPSSHKYGAATYHHIDRYFGPDPEGDTQLMLSENPADPATWKWTSADKLFIDLVRQIHERGMHIIIDGVFNHAGLTFWAFQDIILNAKSSPYYSWYTIEGSGLQDLSHLNDYQTLPDYFVRDGQEPLRYTGFVADLPAFRQDEFGPVEPVRNHLKSVIKRWMDPNQDGDPSDGVDGWRLDVAERVQIGFWELFTKWVTEINPQAYTTGEIWWEDFMTNKQFNAAPWISDGRFDAVMNYRFGDAMFRFFIDRKNQIQPSKLEQLLNSITEDYGFGTSLVLQNLLDSHDMERLASSIVNPDRWMDHANNLQWNKEFDIRKPTVAERETQKVILAFQFTYPGTPYIYYGDEAGMWGADDPDCRKPMVWPEYSYDPEIAHPCDYTDDCSYKRPIDPVEFDAELFAYYHQLCELRKNSPALRRGNYQTVLTDDQTGLFAFERSFGDEKYLAIFHNGSGTISVPEALFTGKKVKWEKVLTNTKGNEFIGKSFIIYRAKR